VHHHRQQTRLLQTDSVKGMAKPETRKGEAGWQNSLSVLRVFVILAAAFFLGQWLAGLIPPTNPWTLRDLRALYPSAASPEAAVTALYTRLVGINCQIRLDYLDLAPEPQYTLEISLGERQVTLSSLTPLPPDVKIELDPVADTLIITLKSCSPHPGTPLLMHTYQAGSAPNTIGPLAFDAPPLSNRVSLQFAFTNTFSPAATPLQALRRWDGAHTGPDGARHGLHDLLNLAEKYKIPLTLLDLRAPVALSAMDYLGGLPQLHRMQQKGLLILPIATFGAPPDVSLALSRAAAKQFGLHADDSFYAPSTVLPFNEPINPDENGLPVAFRRQLVEAALSSSKTILLGGDFQQGTWGTPNYLEPAFAYLAARPYIQFRLLDLPAAPSSPIAEINPAQATAYMGNLALQTPGTDPKLAQNYQGVPADLFDAVQWAQKPTPHAECHLEKELCVLSSDRFYASLSPQGGRLVFFFAGQTQIVGPTAQFFVGFSDSSMWDLSKGVGADPAQIMGAFADADEPFRVYAPEILDEKTIRFKATDGRTKTFRLTENGLEIQLHGLGEASIPLVVSPQSRFMPGWSGKYRLNSGPGGIGWGLASGPMVWIQATGSPHFSATSCLDGAKLLSAPEDPNFAYPAGIALPFPMALIHLSNLSEAVVSISISKK
jgi:hypothetical protein